MTDATEFIPPPAPGVAADGAPELPPPSGVSPTQPSNASDWRRVIFWTAAVLCLVVFILSSTDRSVRHAPWMHCSSNLRQIGLAMKMYANVNNSAYPPSWRELLINEEITSDVFVCYGSTAERATGETPQQIADALVNPTGNHCAYTYAAAGLRDDVVKDDEVLAFETLPDLYDGSVIVLFGDTHTERLDAELGLGRDEATFAHLKADFAAGARPLRLRP